MSISEILGDLIWNDPIGIMSSAIGLKIYAITAGLKNHKSIIKKKKSMIK